MFYTNEEGRFSQPCSLKLKTQFLYELRLEVDQDEMLTRFTIGGKVYNCFTKYKHLGRGTVGYSFVWSTHNIKATGRKHRSVLPCSVRFRWRKELKFDMLVKFYEDQEDPKLFIGSPLTAIDLHVSAGQRMLVGDLCYT